MKKFKWVEWKVPPVRKKIYKDIAYHEGELEDICRGMIHYASKEEFLEWAGEVHDRIFDEYNDWLSTQ